MNTNMPPFHLAIPVIDLSKSEAFYGDLLQCKKGRSSEQWIDWDFYGHQLVTHLVASMPTLPAPNEVDDHQVPVPHFGLVLSEKKWREISQKLIELKYNFVIEPYIRFEGKAGEQGTFFLLDPSGNALEFKYFDDMDQLFAS